MDMRWLGYAAPGLLPLLAGCGGGEPSSPSPAGPTVASVTVIPTQDSIILHGTARFQAQARDSAGNLLTGRTVVWSTRQTPSVSTGARVTVDQTGFVTAVSIGDPGHPETFVAATVDGVSDSAQIVVIIGPLFRVTLAPATATTVPGGSVELLATALDSLDNGVANTVIAWSATGPATVTPAALGTDPAGQVRATVAVSAPGTATVEAAAGAKSATATVSAAPVAFVAVSAGEAVSCGVTGGTETYCWGSNSYGALGADFFDGANLPVRVVGSHAFTKVAAGPTTCGLTAAGATFCWGLVESGLFAPDTADQVNAFAKPVATAVGFAFANLAVASHSHACGLTSGGQAYCWGETRYLGGGSNASGVSPTPVAVAGGLTFTSLSAGQVLTCGTTAAGAASCWGENDQGELGNGDTTLRYAAAPVLVTGGHAFTQVAVGVAHACALTAAGAAYCWGRNYSGELGTTSTEICVPDPGIPNDFIPCSSSPLAVSGGLVFQTIAANTSKTCGLTAAGTAYCWPGPGGSGPTALPGSIHLLTLAVGDRHVCGVADDGLAYCWGDNEALQLGVPGQPSGPAAVLGQQ